MTLNPSSLLALQAGEISAATIEAGTAIDLATQVERTRGQIVTLFPNSRLVSLEVDGGGAGAVFIATLYYDRDGNSSMTMPLMADCVFNFVEGGEFSALATEINRILQLAQAGALSLIGADHAGAGAGARHLAGMAFAQNGTVPPPGTAAADVLGWGNNSVASSTTTRYLEPWFDDAQAPTSAVQWIFPRPGTLSDLYIRHNQPNGNGNDIVYTVRINSVATALAVTLASTGVSASNTTDSVNVLTGDLVDIEVTKAAGIGQTPNDVMATCLFM